MTGLDREYLERLGIADRGRKVPLCVRWLEIPMSLKILFVDDDPNLLAAVQRQIRKLYAIETAIGPEEGLKAVSDGGPFAVIVSDYRMPIMDGVRVPFASTPFGAG